MDAPLPEPALFERPVTSPPRRGSEIMVPVPMAELFSVAAQYERSGKMEEADRLLNYILAVAPDQPDTLHMSGIVAFRLGRQQEALEKMERAIDHSVSILAFICAISARFTGLCNRLDDAVAAARRAVALAPSDPLCLHNLAVIHYERVEIDASIEAAERALMMKPDMAGAHFARAEALLVRGDWAEGWEEDQWRFRIADAARMMPPTDKPQWDGKPFTDGVLLLVADQGFGDVIQFSRYIPWALERCPDAVIACSSEMIPVLRQFLPPDKIIVRWEDAPPFKAFIPPVGPAASAWRPRRQRSCAGALSARRPRACGCVDRALAAVWRRARRSGSASFGPGGRRITMIAAGRRSWRILPRSRRCPAWHWFRYRKDRQPTRREAISGARR